MPSLKKNKIKFLLILLVLFYCIEVTYAQARGGREWNNWYFASGAITFNTNPPSVLDDSKMHAWENCTSISDFNGNLLFYTNGDTVWNRKHEKMGAVSRKHRSGFSCWGGNITIKMPEQDSLYFIFQAPAQEQQYYNNDTPALRYFIVNINKNNGLGEIVGKDNILIVFNKNDRSGREKLGLVRHATKDAWWIVATNENFEFVSFLFDKNGVMSVPIVSPDYSSSAGGYISFSPDGKLMATPNGIFNFNNITGKIEGFFGNLSQYSQHSAFSPNEKFFYYKSNGSKNLFKVDLTQTIPPDKKLKEEILYSPTSSTNNMYALMLAPDKKIYINSETGRYLSVIEKPDEPGLACSLVINKIELKNKNFKPKDGYGLPLIPSSAIYGSFNYIRKCNSLFLLNPEKNTTDSIKWEVKNLNSNIQSELNGDSVEYKLFNKGSLKVKSIIFKNNVADTLFTNIIIDTIFDVSCSFTKINLCKDSAILSATDTTADAYSWSTGDSKVAIKVSAEGFYWVDRFIKGCIIRDSFEVLKSPQPEINLMDTFTFCKGKDIQINAGAGYFSYLWSNGSGDSIITVNKSGYYYLTVSNGCSDSTVKFYVKEINCIIPDTTIQDPIAVKPQCEVFVPNAFTPNDDPVNNYFLPVTECNIIQYKLQVFNRWGEKILDSDKIDSGWDGKYNGKICPDGCYLYIIQAQKLSGEWVYKNGYFYLLR